jgi:hypothetical protein
MNIKLRLPMLKQFQEGVDVMLNNFQRFFSFFRPFLLKINANFVANFFVENIFNIPTSVPALAECFQEGLWP